MGPQFLRDIEKAFPGVVMIEARLTARAPSFGHGPGAFRRLRIVLDHPLVSLLDFLFPSAVLAAGQV